MVDGSGTEVNLAGFIIHSAVHAAREDAACVLHTHSESIVSVASMPEGFLPLSQFAMWFYGRTGSHPYEGVAIEADERVRAHLAPAELDELFDPGWHTRHVDEVMDRVRAL